MKNYSWVFPTVSVFSMLLILGCQRQENNTTAIPTDQNSWHEENDVASEVQRGLWQLNVEDTDHHLKAGATIQFTDQRDEESCMGGKWKRIIVVAKSGSEPEFVPFSEPLAYQLEGSNLALGRTHVCDGYLFLSGKLAGSVIHGTYDAPGPGQTHGLGFFTMERAR